MNIKKAQEHLVKVDRKLGELIIKLPTKHWETRTPDYEALTRIIIGQQLSNSAAVSIFNRVKSLHNFDISPTNTLEIGHSNVKEANKFCVASISISNLDSAVRVPT